MKRTTDFSAIDSIIFDLDGTLWDPSEGILKAWAEATGNITYVKRAVTRQELESVFGMQHDLIGQALFPEFSKAQQDEIIEACYAKEVELLGKEGGRLYPEIEEMLKALAEKHRLFIVSNCQSGYIEAFYAFHGLNKYFEDKECSGDTGQPKAHNIAAIIERNQLKNPIYIGDTQGDKDATEANGIPFVYAEYGFGKVDENEITINEPGELVELILKEKQGIPLQDS